MKNILFLLTLFPIFCMAQIEQPATIYGKKENRLDIIQSLRIPTRCGTPQGTVFASYDSSRAAIMYDSCNNVFYIYNPRLNHWDAGSSGLQSVTDIGNTTTDTIIAEAIRTKRFLPYIYAEPDFEIDVFPDIQNMTYYAPADSRKMFNWVKDNQVSQNIQAVLMLGDLTNFNTTAEWDTVHAQMSILDGIGSSFPYVATVGNHDYGNGFNPAPRDATNYKVHFGPSRYSGKPWFKGYYGAASENFYVSFDVGTRKFFVIALEFLPRDAILTWAGNLCDSLYTADPNRDVIITTHAYQSWTGQLANDTTVYSGSTYGMSADNDGQEMWDKFVKKKPNIKFVFNGHFIVFNYNYITYTQDPSPGIGLTGKIQATGDNGNLVNQIFVNYQDDTAGGQGYFMRMKFHPSTNKIDVSYFSAVKNANDNRASLQPYVIDDQSIAIKNSITTTGVLSAGGEIRTPGFLKSEQIKNNQVVYGREDHSLRTTDSLAYFQKETNGVKAGLYVKPKVTTDTLHVDFQADFNNKAYAVWRGNRTSPTALNIVHDFTDTTASGGPSGFFGFQNSKKYPLPPYFDTRTSFTADANVPQSRIIGHCGTCPGSRFYTYNEIFLADNSVVSSYPDIGDYQYESRQQIRGGASSVNRANTSGLEMGAFISQLFIVSNVDHLGKFFAFKDNITTFDQGNAVDQYYSFYTNHGTTKHIRSWGFYQATALQRNFFKGQTLIGDSSVANASTAQLYINGTVKIVDGNQTDGKVFTSDANGLGSWQSNSGTYTPTITGGANFSSSSGIVGKYQRVGNIVSVTIAGTVTPTAGGSSVIFDVSLPTAYPSNFTAQMDAFGGGAASFAGSNENIFALANTTDDRFQLSMSAVGSTSGRFFAIEIKYEIK